MFSVIAARFASVFAILPQSAAPRALAVIGVTLVAACSTTPPPAPPRPVPPVERPEPKPVDVPVEPGDDRQRTGLVPPHMDGRDIARVALLLPFSSSSSSARAESLRLLRAAELALFERAGGSLLIIPKDTAGTPAGARAAARAALEDGADLIVGPLFGPAATAVGQVARQHRIPVIAFTTDASAGGDGVYLMSFPPRIEVERVVEFASRQGVERFAYLGPQNDYGMAVYEALQRSTAQYGARVEGEAFYTGDVEAMSAATRQLTRGRFAPFDEEEEMPDAAASGEWVPDPAAAFQAVILPESGTRLRTLGPLLISHNVDPGIVRFLGTGLWHDPELLREPALRGAWFAGPDQAARARFDAAYSAAYGSEPSRIASLAYDAIAVAAHLDGGEDGFSRRAIEEAQGFLGADGLFRFGQDGMIERGLAVYELRSSGFREIDPAPLTFQPVMN